MVASHTKGIAPIARSIWRPPRWHCSQPSESLQGLSKLAEAEQDQHYPRSLEIWVCGLLLKKLFGIYKGLYSFPVFLVASILKPLHPKSKVVKSNNLVCMTHKAFNGRIITQYLAEAMARIINQDLDVPAGRLFGRWLKEKMEAGSISFPVDESFPVMATCMSLASKLSKGNMVSRICLNYQKSPNNICILC